MSGAIDHRATAGDGAAPEAAGAFAAPGVVGEWLAAQTDEAHAAIADAINRAGLPEAVLANVLDGAPEASLGAAVALLAKIAAEPDPRERSRLAESLVDL